MKKICLGLLLLLSAAMAHSQQPGTRVALVIGVQNYTSVPPLQHSLNDATDMAASLKSKGFRVEFLKDPKSKKEIKDAVTRYYNTMRALNKAVGIIYYAGHGTQFEGENYLIPASASIQVPGDMDEQCVKMNTLMSVLTSSNNNLNILLLDACRTNSFPSFSRDMAQGLTNVEAPTGSIVVFATQPGRVASDGSGKNGLFTSKLLKYINEPNLNIGDLLKRVKQDVNAESQGKQLPSVVDNSIGGDFYFTPAAAAIGDGSELIASKEKHIAVLGPAAGRGIVIENKNRANYFLDKYREEFKPPRLRVPPPFAHAILYSDLGFVEVSVDYNRPTKRDREYFGAGDEHLYPYGKIWWPGVKVYFSKDVTVSGKPVAKGAYGIYMWPGEASYSVALYRNLVIGGATDRYDAKDEITRFESAVQKPANTVNTLTTHVDRTSNNSGNICIQFENQNILVPFATVEPDSSTGVTTAFERIGISEVLINHFNSVANIPNSDGKFNVGSISFQDKSVVGGKAFNAGTYQLYFGRNRIWIGNDMLNLEPRDKGSRASKISVQIAEVIGDKRSAILVVAVGNKEFRAPVVVDYAARIEQMIASTMSNSPTPNECVDAARYYLDNNINLKKALAWTDLGIQASRERTDLRFLKSRIQKALGDRKGAKSTAEEGLDISRRIRNSYYEAQFEELIRTLK
jgi:hypothetical protein